MTGNQLRKQCYSEMAAVFLKGLPTFFSSESELFLFISGDQFEN